MDASLSLILAFNFCCSISDVDIIMLLGCASTFSLIGIFIIKDMWLHFLPDNVDLFHILGSCCHPSSAGLVAENEKYRQLDWTIHFTLGVMYLSFLTICESWLCSHLNLFSFFFFLLILFAKGFYLGFYFFKWRSQFLFILLILFEGWVFACSSVVKGEKLQKHSRYLGGGGGDRIRELQRVRSHLLNLKMIGMVKPDRVLVPPPVVCIFFVMDCEFYFAFIYL